MLLRKLETREPSYNSSTMPEMQTLAEICWIVTLTAGVTLTKRSKMALHWPNQANGVVRRAESSILSVQLKFNRLGSHTRRTTGCAETEVAGQTAQKYRRVRIRICGWLRYQG